MGMPLFRAAVENMLLQEKNPNYTMSLTAEGAGSLWRRDGEMAELATIEDSGPATNRPRGGAIYFSPKSLRNSAGEIILTP
jgi:hypothetical protein